MCLCVLWIDSKAITYIHAIYMINENEFRGPVLCTQMGYLYLPIRNRILSKTTMVLIDFYIITTFVGLKLGNILMTKGLQA